jgi:phospholipase/lecithinase/hemolysin
MAVILMLLGSIGVAGPPDSGGQFSEIVVFGDSQSDTGNVFAATGGAIPPPPYFNGRFSNGPLWVDVVASQLGLAPVLPSLVGGSNYAFASAETGDGLSSPWSVPNLGMQVEMYLDGNEPDGTELFVVLGGTNDFINAGQTDPSIPAANIAEYISTLADAGAITFLVPNLAPLGIGPLTVGTPLEAYLNYLAVQFNALLDLELDIIEATRNVRILRLDVFGSVSEVVANPGSFGLVNVTEPAFDALSGTTVPNPDEYLFWDYEGHATTAVQQLLGLHATAVIPPNVVCMTRPTILSPANHKMIDVDICVAARDIITPAENLSLLGVFVTSNEPDNSVADGDTEGDCNGEDGFLNPVEVTGVFSPADAFTSPDGCRVFFGTIQLRAERAGTGAGRIYSIKAVVADENGGVGDCACEVRVSHAPGHP